MSGMKRYLETLTKSGTYVYMKTEPCLFTVGFFDPSGKWHPESDFATAEEAASRVNWLNGQPDRDKIFVNVEIEERDALKADAERKEPIGYIDRKDIARLSNYKATIWPGTNEIDAVPVYLAAMKSQGSE